MRGAGLAQAAPVQILEAGAHDGGLALDILRWLRATRPELLDSLEYWILEPSARRRQWQENTLREFSRRVRWFEDWNALPPSGVNGLIFSNELLDAFPVHRLGWDAATKNGSSGASPFAAMISSGQKSLSPPNSRFPPCPRNSSPCCRTISPPNFLRPRPTGGSAPPAF